MLTIDALAQEIRRVDGNHSLGAGALAEALYPFLSALVEEKPVAVKALEDAYAAGFNASSEGYNAEYFPEYASNEEWLAERDGSISRIRSALVDVPAVESEPDGWLCTAPPGVWSSGRVDTDNANVQAWRDRDYTCIPYWLSPSVAHPPRSLSDEGSEVIAAAQRYVDSVSHDPGARASDKAWRAHDKEKQDAFDALRAALSTRKGSFGGDGSATITKDADHG